MIKADVDSTVKQLTELELVIKRKLERMVERFAEDVGRKAIDNTPIGDAVTYAERYRQRFEQDGLRPVAGFARGSWRYAVNESPMLQEYYSGSLALDGIKGAVNFYKLGQKFYITNSGPYIAGLEAGVGSKQQAPDGIKQPTLEQVQAVYRADLPRYYKES